VKVLLAIDDDPARYQHLSRKLARHEVVVAVVQNPDAEGVWAGNTPRQSHEGWLAEKVATGWKYGPVKNPEAKEHPCMVAYEELPTSQRVKDHIFVSVVRAVTEAFLHGE
jgi:hypothetical protein